MLVVCFSIVEKKNFSSYKKTKLIFLLYVVFCSYWFKPSINLYLWVAITLLLYCVLDDLITTTLNIYLPLLLTLIFLFFVEKIDVVLFSFLIFAIFLFLSKMTKEHVMGEGDPYIMLPILLLLPTFQSMISFLLLSFLLSACVLIPLFFYKKEMEYPFSPFLVASFVLHYSFSDLTWIYLFSFVIAMICSISLWIYQKINKKNKPL